ncbi:MAG: hypothetical protein IIB75_05300 [Proteobacteria bacterium]|nr:hypothetical protein [Pseudomonadota bacterium]
MAHPYFAQLRQLLDDADLNETDIVCKHFFSGAAAYACGHIFASLTPKGLAFKLTGKRCVEVIEKGKGTELTYFENSPVKKGYVLFRDFAEMSKGDLRRYFSEALSIAGLEDQRRN